MFAVALERTFYIREGASSGESLVLQIYFSILIVNLDLMEALIAHASGVHDKATLSVRTVILFVIHVMYI